METGIHRVIYGILGLVFLTFAAVQYNDPDPLTWIAVYSYVVVLIGVSLFRRLPLIFSVSPMIAAVAGCILLWPEEFMGLSKSMDSHINVELARESLGLLICAMACAYIGIRSYQRGRKRVLVG